MIDLFQIAQKDQSVTYLGQIYGYVGSLLPVTNPPLLIGILFKTLNTVALSVGALLVVYVTVVGLLKSAQEGEFLGRQWNSLWVPIRMVMGIAALFPTATGYSAIQVIIMWIILQGVGAADTLWTKVMQFVQVVGSPTSAVDSSKIQTAAIQNNIQLLFQSLMCQASAKASYAPVILSSGGKYSIEYYCGNPSVNDPWCKNSASDMLNPIAGSQVSNNTYSIGPGGVCGRLQYCDASAQGDCKPEVDPNNPSGVLPESLKCFACKAQQSALQAIVPTLGAVADQLVAIDHTYLNFYEVGSKDVPGWLQNYCAAESIPTEKCCVQAPTTAPGQPPVVCSAGAFPSDTSSPNYTNTSSANSSKPLQPSAAATNLYLKYPLQTYLNGSDFINAAVGEYQAALVGAVSSYLQNQMSNTPLKDWETTAQSYGWMMAGGFYYKIAGEKQNNQDAANPLFQVTGKDQSLNSVIDSYRNNYSATKDLLDMMVNQNKNNSPVFAGPPGMADDISQALGSSAASLASTWQSNLTTGSANPIIAIASFGYDMMIIAQVSFAVIVTLIAVAVGVATVDPMVLGTGFTMSPFGEAVKAVTSFLGPFFVILIGSLYSIGALLAIYVPLIPYMVFSIGAIGWLIATVEAMVAGPIVALGILSPGGQHDILGKAEPAMMQLFNLFLRPSLMIIGMMVAMLMSNVVINFINAGFLAVSSEVITNPGLFEQILFIAAYTSFVITVLNKTFSLIYVVPERVLTWIGGPAVQYGEAEALGATKQAIEGAASGVGGAAKESGASVSGGMQGYKHAKLEEEAREGKGAGLAALKKKEEAQQRGKGK